MILLDALSPDPGTARDWLREELSRREYQPSLPERFTSWVDDLFERVREATLAAGGLSTAASVVLLVLLGVGVALLLSRLGRNPAVSTGPGPVFAESRQTASDHRSLAQRAVARGDWDEAVVESTRALAAGLFERELLPEEPGTTAQEVTERAALMFPELRRRLEQAARIFDETRYGDRRADEERARTVVVVEDAIRTGTPSRAPSPAAVSGPVAAVPR